MAKDQELATELTVLTSNFLLCSHCFVIVTIANYGSVADEGST